MKTVVLAFSGGLDTCWCVPWLTRELGVQVVTVTVDVGGFDAAARAELAAKSRALGAANHHHVDARERFWDEVVRYLLLGQARKGGTYPYCVGAERGLQARLAAELAREIGAVGVAHGCTGAGNDQVRFEIALRAAAPELDVIAPVRDVAPTREQQVADLAASGLELPASTGSYSINAGMWGATIGGRETLVSTGTLPEEAWLRTRGAFDDPAPPRPLKLGFVAGTPTSVDGVELAPVELIATVDDVAGPMGIGRGIHLGETILGTKGRVAYEAPAAEVLLTAMRELSKLVLTGEQISLVETVGRRYGELVHGGRHVDPACRDVEALLRSAASSVTGEVQLRLMPGFVFVEGVDSPRSLMTASRSTYGEATGEWSPEEARGFARLIGMPSILHARAAEEKS